MEIGIEESDRPEVFMALETDNVVGFPAQVGKRAGGSNRHGQYQFPWFSNAGRLQRGAHGRAGGDTVIDHDRDAPGNWSALTICKIALTPALDFGEFALTGGFELLFADAGQGNNVFIAHDHRLRPINDRAHRQLGLKRHADLADKDQVERSIKRPRDFGRDRHASARQSENSHLLMPVFNQRGCESMARI